MATKIQNFSDNIIRSIHGFGLTMIAIILFSFMEEKELFAQTNLYWNNTTTSARSWTAVNGNGNGLWRTAPTGGTFQSATTLNDIADFNANTAIAGAHDIYFGTGAFTAPGQAAYGMVFGVGPNATGPFRIRSSFNTVVDRNFTLGAGGITVNSGVQGVSFSNKDIVNNVQTGELNVVLQASQTWTNHSATPLTFGGQLVGANGVTLSKDGIGTLILSADNRAVNINGTIGFKGKMLVNAGTLVVANSNALGATATNTSDSSSSIVDPNLPMFGDTIVAVGATLDINDQPVGREFVSVAGSGVSGQGSIVNNAAGAGSSSAYLSDLRLTGDTTIGGATAKWDIRSKDFNTARLFQNGYTITKTGGNTIGLISTSVTGSGNINVQQGTLSLGGSTNITGNGTLAVSSGANLSLSNYSGTINRPILLAGNNIVARTDVGTNSFISSNITVNGPVTFGVPDADTDPTIKTLFLKGTTTGTGDITKTGAGQLTVRLGGSNYVGSSIDVRGGFLSFATSGQVNANIRISDSSSLSDVGTVGIRGEGKTTGQLSFGAGNTLTIDGATNGLDQYLRVGSLEHRSAVPIQVFTTSLLNGQSDIVVLESANNDVVPSNFALTDVRGQLRSNGPQLLLDHQIANLVWQGNHPTNPSSWDVLNTNNWLNNSTSTSDRFFQPDSVVFDDTVGAGSTSVVIQSLLSPTNVQFNNSLVNYTLTPGTNGGGIKSVNGVLTKQGTGTVSINTDGNQFASTDVRAGVLEIGRPGIFTDSNLGNITIQAGATVRSLSNSFNSGIGGTAPIAVNLGGAIEWARNGTDIRTISNPISGSGDVRLNGVSDGAGGSPYANFQVAAQTAFDGTWRIENALANLPQNLGNSTVVVRPNSSVRFSGAAPSVGRIVLDSSGVLPIGSTYRTPTLSASGTLVAPIELKSDARIDVGVLASNVSGVGAVDFFGTVVTGSNSYVGNTTLRSGTSVAGNDRAFGSGSVSIDYDQNLGSGGGILVIADGVNVANPIRVALNAGTPFVGAIQGSVPGNPNLVPTLSGPIQLDGARSAYPHFSSGSANGSALKISGPINVADPATQEVIHGDGGIGSYTEFSGGGNYQKFNLRGGTVRIGEDNGLPTDVEISTLNAGLGRLPTFDLHGHDQTISQISGFPSIMNSGSGTSTLTISGNGDNSIFDMPPSQNGGILNIVKNGTGSLAFLGDFSSSSPAFENTGTYTINGGRFIVATSIFGSIVANNATIETNSIRIGGASVINNSILALTETLTFDSSLKISGNSVMDVSIPSYITASTPNSIDNILVHSTLDLTDLDSFFIKTNETTLVAPTRAWLLLDSDVPIVGFDASDFVVDRSLFHEIYTNQPVQGTFWASLENSGTAIYLNFAVPVPEPTSWMLLVSSLCVSQLGRHRRCSSND